MNEKLRVAVFVLLFSFLILSGLLIYLWNETDEMIDPSIKTGLTVSLAVTMLSLTIAVLVLLYPQIFALRYDSTPFVMPKGAQLLVLIISVINGLLGALTFSNVIGIDDSTTQNTVGSILVISSVLGISWTIYSVSSRTITK